MTAPLPAGIESETQLDDLLTTPSPALIETMGKLDSDLIILGVAGKMGPTLARLARRALDEAGSKHNVIGVARFSQAELADQLQNVGVQTIKADLLDTDALNALPNAKNIIFMAGRKFGSTGQEELTWAMNTYLPALVAQRYRDARIVAISTGNVYPFMTPESGGPTEDQPTDPVGEYAQSCLGRERMFQYFSVTNKTPTAIIRLNYAVDLRYGVIMDVGRKVFDEQPIDLAMGYANVIWQGDANTAILQALDFCASPPFILNLTGPEIVSIRKTAEQFGEIFGKKPIFEGTENQTALLNNASRYFELMGKPTVSLQQLTQWAAQWVQAGGASIGKPTHYEARNGKF